MVQQVCLVYARGVTTQMAGRRLLLTGLVLRRLNSSCCLLLRNALTVHRETMTGIRVGLFHLV